METRETATVDHFVLWADWLSHSITWSTRKTWSLKSLEINIWHFNTFLATTVCVEIYLELQLDKRLHVIILVELENRN